MFPICDFSKGISIALDEVSSLLITSNAPFGRFRFTRMLFGMTVARDNFQHKIYIIYNVLDFFTGIADDTVMFTELADGSDNNEHLARFLQCINNK